ncbi:YjjG family noncanonical pyrimidine nucleotidase [Owenweeksia hongkongensis]|uniref:YjjG family noncanonical pyrimidine nucleotidase n=1 Tax=Owenweeksia hongkongensis TaxID=253245 RepID=UPI003A8D3F51
MTTKYNHLFFDLDHTLWDFEANSRLTLLDLFVKHNLEQQLKTEYEDFYKSYIKVNDGKWALYRTGGITKEQLRLERFRDTFSTFGYVDNEFAAVFESEYLSICPHKTQLLPGTEELLEYLRKRYELHVITNGFLETQKIKMKESGLELFFQSMISSEEIGVNKPAPQIFEKSLKRTGADSKTSLMIGDSLHADILGAQSFGMDQVFYNPLKVKHNERPTFEISHLLEMKNFL